ASWDCPLFHSILLAGSLWRTFFSCGRPASLFIPTANGGLGDDSTRFAPAVDAADPLRLSVVFNGATRHRLSAHLGVSLFTRALGRAGLRPGALSALSCIRIRLYARSRAQPNGVVARWA